MVFDHIIKIRNLVETSYSYRSMSLSIFCLQREASTKWCDLRIVEIQRVEYTMKFTLYH